jgi:hypothetical protein
MTVPAVGVELQPLRELEHRLAAHARRLEREHDSRCVFTHAYALMTKRIADELPLTPDVDAEWLVALAQAFGARYVAALEAAPDELTPAWKTAFDAMHRSRTSVVEDLVFAMTVHIVHDLPLALGDVSHGDPPPEAHIYDFHAINAIMAGCVDLIQKTVAKRYSPYIAWLDKLAEGYDEILTNYGVRMSRGLAWYNAQRIADGRSRADALAAIERSPAIVVTQVIDPPILSLRIALRGARFLVSFFRRWPDERTERGLTL